MDTQTIVTGTGNIANAKGYNKQRVFIYSALAAVAIIALGAVAFILVGQNHKAENNIIASTATPQVTKPIVTTVVPTTTTIVTPKPSVIVFPTTIQSTPQAIKWKEMSFNVGDLNDIIITGQFPIDTTIKPTGDSPATIASNKNYAMSFNPTSDGTVTHYDSYKFVVDHIQFGIVYRIRSYANANSNSASYVTQASIKTTGTCDEYQGTITAAPCGRDILLAAKEGIGLYLDCSASLSDRDSICDVIVKSLRVKHK